MNNLLSYYGLVDTRISASEKDLPVLYYLKIQGHGIIKKFSIYRLYLENIANVTISLVIGTTESFVLGLTMEDAFVANANVW